MGCFSNCGGNSCWIIILLLLFCGNNDGCGCNHGGFIGGNDCGCLWIILLLLFCGCGNNNSGYVTTGNNGCGCSTCNTCNTCC